MEELFYSLIVLLVALLGFFLVPFGLPGNWVIAAAALLAALTGITEAFGWLPFWLLLGAALLAEIGEFLFAAGKTRESGGTKWGALGALVGSLIGGFLGFPLLPVIGSIFGAAFGAFAGVTIVEIGILGRSSDKGMSAGRGAFFGVLFGRSWKILIAAVQVAVLAWTLFL